MSSYITICVEEWYDAKEKLIFYQKQVEHYKQKVIEFMGDKDKLETTNFTVYKDRNGDYDVEEN
jgi:hypothetical protein